jgi:hypothetical protein
MRPSSIPEIKKPMPPPKLPDDRLVDRFKLVSRALEQNPHQSFPALFPNRSELEAFYRFVNNARVNFADLMEPNYTNAVQECRQRKLVLAIHDTSVFSFSQDTPIEGIGRTTRGQKGFFGHFCIATSLDRDVLGVLGLDYWVRGNRLVGNRKRALRTRESQRWSRLIKKVHHKLEDHPNAIHVADSEADDYSGYCCLVEKGIRFVIRATHNRRIVDEEKRFPKLFDSLDQAHVVCEREVPISARKRAKRPHERRSHPARKKRLAKLGICAKTIEICRGRRVGSEWPKTLNLHFLRIFEMDPPSGEKPIEWILVTTEPIDNASDLERIVDIYCARWTIEEYLKALKAGCSFEKRGLESLHGLLNCLALFAPIAVKLYNLKVIGRKHPQRRAADVINQAQVEILAEFTKTPQRELQTLGSLMGAVAAMGGHIKHNGPPGWQVIARGYEKLIQLEIGWKLASKQLPRGDHDPMQHV